MTIPTVEEIRKGLKKDLEKMFNAWETFYQSRKALSTMGIHTTPEVLLHKATAIRVGAYFEFLAEMVSKANYQGVPGRVSIPYRLTHFDMSYDSGEAGLSKELYQELMSAEGKDRNVQLKLLEEVLNRIDYDAIVNAMRAQVDHMDGEGLQVVVDDFLKAFNFFPLYGGTMFKTDRHVVLCMKGATSESAPQRQEDLHKVHELHDRISYQYGINFGFTVNELGSALHKIELNPDSICPGTILGEGCDVEIACYNEQYSFRYTRKAFDAINEYINRHGKGEYVEQWQNLVARLELPKES